MIYSRSNILDRRIANLDAAISRLNNTKDRFIQQKNNAIAKIDNNIFNFMNNLNQNTPRFVSFYARWKQRYTMSFDRRIQYVDKQIAAYQKTKDELIKTQQYSPAPIDTTNPVPDVPSPPAPAPVNLLVDITKTVHNAMMLYMKNNWQFGENENNFVIPYIPKNMNFRLETSVPASSHQGAEDWKQCIYPSLGSSRSGLRASYTNTYLELHGYFTSKDQLGTFGQLLNFAANSNSILSSGEYVLRNVYIPPTGILTNDDRNIRLNYVPNNTSISAYLNSILQSSLDETAINAINRTVDALSRWARDTAFLVPVPFCTERSWYQTYGNPIYNPSAQSSSTSVGINLSEGDPMAELPRNYCSSVYDPVCDTVNDITYTNACEAKKVGVVGAVPGVCNRMVAGINFGNISGISQTPTEAKDDKGIAFKDSSNSSVILPNLLQAEYFRRLYYFIAKNMNKVSNTNDLANWAINYLQSYATFPVAATSQTLTSSSFTFRSYTANNGWNARDYGTQGEGFGPGGTEIERFQEPQRFRSTFYVSVFNPNKIPLTYQWQRWYGGNGWKNVVDGYDLSGAKSSSLRWEYKQNVDMALRCVINGTFTTKPIFYTYKVYI